jgi:hypothetical protein
MIGRTLQAYTVRLDQGLDLEEGSKILALVLTDEKCKRWEICGNMSVPLNNYCFYVFMGNRNAIATIEVRRSNMTIEHHEMPK